MLKAEGLKESQVLEADGLYFAARNEYRLVLLIDSESVEGRAGLDRMDGEARAMRSLAEADMEIRRGELESAEETLAAAELLTEAQKDGVSLPQSGIEERRLEDIYQEAQGLYEDYRYPEAVAAYEELLALEPDFRDAYLLMRTIEEFIRLAEEFYAKALASDDETEAEEYLRAIHPVIWPEYRDVVERLAAIDARKAAARAAVEAQPDGKGGENEPPSGAASGGAFDEGGGR